MPRIRTLRPSVALISTNIGRSFHTLKRLGEDKRMRGRALMQRNARMSGAQPLCVHCLAEGTERLGTQWDHKVPLCEGGPDTEANLQHLCDAHHERKTIAEAKARSLGNGFA